MRPATNFFCLYKNFISDWFPRITGNIIGIPASRLGFPEHLLVPGKDVTRLLFLRLTINKHSQIKKLVSDTTCLDRVGTLQWSMSVHARALWWPIMTISTIPTTVILLTFSEKSLALLSWPRLFSTLISLLAPLTPTLTSIAPPPPLYLPPSPLASHLALPLLLLLLLLPILLLWCGISVDEHCTLFNPWIQCCPTDSGISVHEVEILILMAMPLGCFGFQYPSRFKLVSSWGLKWLPDRSMPNITLKS